MGVSGWNNLLVSESIDAALPWRLWVHWRRLQWICFNSRLEPKPISVRVCVLLRLYVDVSFFLGDSQMCLICHFSAGECCTVQQLPPVPEKKHPKQTAGGFLGPARSGCVKPQSSGLRDFSQITPTLEMRLHFSITDCKYLLSNPNRHWLILKRSDSICGLNFCCLIDRCHNTYQQGRGWRKHRVQTWS